MTALTPASPSEPPQRTINKLWKALLEEYPDGVSNTSTTKYIPFRQLLADILSIPLEEVYATGAKTRTSNLDTRFVQGNQAGRYTKLGVAVMQTAATTAELEKLSNSCVVTSSKFVDGSDKTQYDAIAIFVELNDTLVLTRVIQRKLGGYYDILKRNFPQAKLIVVGGSAPLPSSSTSHSARPGSERLSIDIVESFVADAAAANFRFQSELVTRFVASLMAKRFLILTGLAGSGKTKVAQAFARWMASRQSETLDARDQRYSLVPVGADWIGNENIVGYPNGLDATNYVTKPALDLMLHATNNVDIPHFLLLDEMNLSHVERYFADILSIIESDEGLELYAGDMDKPDTWRRTAATSVPPRLRQLPENVFIIGTVNVDETTYMFSPKVLDRANVIEFRMDVGELEGFLDNPSRPNLSKLDGKGGSYGKAFVDAGRTPVAVPADVKVAYNKEMLLLFEALQGHGAEFGYRTAYESARFVHFYKLLGNHADDDNWFSGAFDCVVFQKLLPKLHGSRAKLGPVLKKLWFLCVNDAAGRGADALKAAEEAARSTDKEAEPSVVIPAGAPYPLSAQKIGRMWRLLIENGFASFAEA